eukprot:CAMPEP_0196579034 /NCGR_PEP_ID=MMETSP1081-20130531/16255_1 /TAXON_ID=36882 /ORGANISM="Pyramimonas amylifera, Strain CCMP720" /LENGTH=178 /DNA_ID=CAMNT_0041898467 /DNA_START=25 /DNA_END=561 /DNA_ORIENTATION=-
MTEIGEVGCSLETSTTYLSIVEEPTTTAGDTESITTNDRIEEISLIESSDFLIERPPLPQFPRQGQRQDETREMNVELTNGLMSDSAIRGRIVNKLRVGFSTIEEMGFGGDAVFQREWEEHKSKVERFFIEHHPSDADFSEARKALTGEWHAKCQNDSKTNCEMKFISSEKCCVEQFD